MSVITIYRFDDVGIDADELLERLNTNFAALVAEINALAGQRVLQLGTESAGADPVYAQLIGAAFLGQVSAPSLLVGPVGGTQYPVVTTNDAATEATRGAVLKAAASANAAGNPGGTYSQAEVTAILTELRDLKTKLRAAGMLAT